jgi:hypothetical protein
MHLVRSAQFGEWQQVTAALVGAPAELPLDALLVEAVRGNALRWTERDEAHGVPLEGTLAR